MFEVPKDGTVNTDRGWQAQWEGKSSQKIMSTHVGIVPQPDSLYSLFWIWVSHGKCFGTFKTWNKTVDPKVNSSQPHVTASLHASEGGWLFQTWTKGLVKPETIGAPIQLHSFFKGCKVSVLCGIGLRHKSCFFSYFPPIESASDAQKIEPWLCLQEMWWA